MAIGEIEHMAYCVRQWALISMERTWADNRSTAVGQVVHERADVPAARIERGLTVLRGLSIWSDAHGLVGRADVVEVTEDGTPFPVEYKSGRRLQAAAEVQLAAQAICLSEMFGCEVDYGAIWLHGTRRRYEVTITASIKAMALAYARAIREHRRRHVLPAPVRDARCRDCSLTNECLPGPISDRPRTAALHASLFVASVEAQPGA